MSDRSGELFDRDELLAGLPARRANALLFLIESRTAHLVARSRQAMERFLTEEAAQQRQLAFLEAFALGRDPPLRPTIQDLERHATAWADLVAKNPRVQAAVAHRLGQKYEFTQSAVPGVRAALGLDEPEVRDAYQRLYHEPLETIFAGRPGIADRIRWAWSALSGWLENLSPFWTAYALTLTETVGATILALPIALAGIGPLPGVVILVVLGLVNVGTVSLLAESISRSGTMRYGSTFFGRLASDYLGPGGAAVVTASVFLLCLLVLPVFYTGFAGTLKDATSVPSAVWVVLLFLVGLYYLRRQSLNSTIAAALVVGAASITLVVALSLLGFAHATGHNLLYERVPFIHGRPFQSAIVGLIFGVVLAGYFGHMSVGLCGQLVLRRDPSGRSLVRGCAAAQTTAILLYCLFVLAVNGAVPPHALAHDTGTAIGPLAQVVGPAANVLGSVFVTLGLGLGSITFSLALFGVVTERLPSASPIVLALPRRGARLLFEPRRRARGSDTIHLGLTYLGLDGGEPRFRLDAWRGGELERFEATAPSRWDVLGTNAARPLLDRFPELREDGCQLELEVTGADEQSVRLRITSSLKLAYEGSWDTAGLSLADVIALPDSDAELVGWITRRGAVSLRELAERTGGDRGAARERVAPLLQRGVIAETRADGQARYTVRVAARRGGRLPDQIWQALAPADGAEASSPAAPLGRASRMRTVLLGKRGRFLIAAAPVAAAFVAAEWMVLAGAGSFAGVIDFVGSIVVALLAGIFPVLLIVSSRRRGEHVPGTVVRWLGNPVLLGAIYVFFLGSLFLHGLTIWTNPVTRAAALLAGVGVVAMTLRMIRRGSFFPRANIELRDDEASSTAAFAVTAAGEPADSDVVVEHAGGELRLAASRGEIPAFAALRRVTFRPSPETGKRVARQLKVRVHRVNSDNDSQPVPARLELDRGDEARPFDLEPAAGEALLALTDAPWSVDITFPEH